jgi:hypothetical protein
MNKELFAKKTGTRNIPIAHPLSPRPMSRTISGKSPTTIQQLDPSLTLERLDPEIFWPGKYRFCGIKEGCWEIEFSPKTKYLPYYRFPSTRYRGTLRVERDGFSHTISGDLYKFREYIFELERRGIPLKTVNKWQNLTYLPERLPAKRFYPTKKKCPVYARNKYHSYLEGTSILYSILTVSDKCSYTLNFDQWNYTHPASGFDGDFGTTADRSIRMELNEVSSKFLTGTLYEGSTNLGSIKLWWRSKYFRKAHLEVFTLEGAEHPPTSVPDGSGGTESFETIFATAGMKLQVTRNATKIPLPASLSGTAIDDCWSWDDLHDLMDSTPGYNNSELDKKWRVFLVTVPAKLGCSRGVVFDQTTGVPAQRRARGRSRVQSVPPGIAEFHHVPDSERCGRPSCIGRYLP